MAETWTPPAADKVSTGWQPPATDAVPRRQARDIAGDDLVTLERRELQGDLSGAAVAKRNQIRREREQFVKENVEAGTPLDIDAGLPAEKRARLSFESDIDKQVEILTKQGLQVRKSKDGQNLIVRHEGRDVLLHPKNDGISGGDVAGATFPLIKAGATTAAALGTGSMSLLGQAGVLAGSAALTHAAGEGGSRLAAGQDMEGVADRAMTEGIINGGLPLAGAAVKGGANLVRNRLLSGAGELEKKLPEAAARLGVTPTVGETTGSPALAKLGKLKPAEETERQGALKATQDRAISPSGRAPVLAEDDIAQKAKPIFSDAEQAASKQVREGLSDAEKAANAQIQAQLDSGITPTTLTNSESGKFLRGKFEAFEQKVRDDAAKNYPIFHQKAAEEGIVLDKKPVVDLVKQIEKEDPTGAAELLAPSIKQVKNVEEALTKPLAPATPPKRIGFAVEPGKPAVPAPDLTFQDAIRLRSIVRTKLNSPTDPLGDVVKSYYSRLEKALTDTIDDGLKRGSPELRAAYDAARGSYAQGADALDRGVVQKLFRNVGESGRVPDEDVVRQVFSGPGNLTALQDMKNILEPQDYKLLLRAGLNNIVEDAKGAGKMVDAGKFLNRLSGLDKEVRAEVLGPLEKELLGNARLMARAQGAKVPLDELEDALASKSGAARLLENAMTREQAYDRTFKSTVQQRLRNGVLDPKTVNDDRFVSYLMGDGVSAADTRQALTQIAAKDPAVAEQVRQRVLTNVLDDVGVKAPLGKETTREVFDADHSKLAALLKPGTPSREKLQAAVGNEGVQFLEDLATYAEATAKRQVNESGRHVSPETLMKEIGSAALGFKRNAVGALVDVTAPLARAAGGGALVRSAAFKRWLETGELPNLGGKIGRAAILAAPEALRAKDAVLAEKP